MIARPILALACLIAASVALFSPPIATATERTALVIGNATYSELGVLPNASADAKAIAAVLQQLGYETQLVIDADDARLRKEVRKFAASSDNAKIALISYAGHGAQVNGENYLLPVDIGIPQHESDIQLTGLKVDDLVNSIRSETKVVFLDACRDNPALFKNLVKGRGRPIRWIGSNDWFEPFASETRRRDIYRLRDGFRGCGPGRAGRPQSVYAGASGPSKGSDFHRRHVRK